MRTVRVSQYNAFSKVASKGNPAGVVLGADGMSPEDMQQTAECVGFNETVFVLSSNQADIRLRYFTPGHEMDLCGHGTVAAIFALRSRQRITADKMTIETNVGCFPVEVKWSTDETFVVTMEQTSMLRPKMSRFPGTAFTCLRLTCICIVEFEVTEDTCHTCQVQLPGISAVPGVNKDAR